LKLEIFQDECLDKLKHKVNAFFIKNEINKKDIIKLELKDNIGTEFIKPKYIYSIVYDKR